MLSDRRRKQVDLEFDAKHGRSFGHSRQARVTAGRIGDGRDCSGVNKAVLLLDRLRPRKFDIDLPVRNANESGTESREQSLPVKRFSDSVM